MDPPRIWTLAGFHFRADSNPKAGRGCRSLLERVSAWEGNGFFEMGD